MKHTSAIILALFILALLGTAVLSLLMPESEAVEKALVISPYVAPIGYEPEDCGENTIYQFEALEPGVPRLLAPPKLSGMENYNVRFEFDGTIFISADEVQLSIDNDLKPFYSGKGHGLRTFGYEFHFDDSGYVSLMPIGGGSYMNLDEKTGFFDKTETEVGHEYYVRIEAYRDISDQLPAVTAILKLVKLEDPSVTSDDANSSYSGYFSIELVSYD